MVNIKHPTSIKKWLTAVRPWSFPASAMPVLFGSSLAFIFGKNSFNVVYFILALAAMVILHSAANLLSDVFDYKRGLDKRVTPVSGAVVRGWVTAKQAYTAAIILFFIGSAIGIYLVFKIGITLLIIGAVGVAIGVFYTALKYHAIGDLSVFLNFGILGSLGAWVVQTKSFSWIPVFWTIPMAMLVSAILHANNWRDAATDKDKKVATIANILGDKISLGYYAALIFGPFLTIGLLIIIPLATRVKFPAMPLTFLITILALFNAIKLWKRALLRHNPENTMDFIILDGATAQHNLIFGVLCTVSVWVYYFIGIL